MLLREKHEEMIHDSNNCLNVCLSDRRICWNRKDYWEFEIHEPGKACFMV